jgi:hypothetical protein
MSWQSLKISKNILFKIWNLWPPFLGAGIKLGKMDKDFRWVEAHLKLHWWNRNYVGTQFGGSMFMMTDPFYMVLFLHTLGNDYIVWDKAATIRYLKPGKTDLMVRFELSEEDLNLIRTTLEKQEKMDWTTTVHIRNTNNEVVAEVDKVIYIRKKSRQSPGRIL